MTPVPTGISYIEILNSCNYAYAGTCVNLRSGPGTNYSVVMQLRNNMVFRLASTTVDSKGQTWYEIRFDGPIHYPERVTSDWYVNADYARTFMDPGVLETNAGMNASSTKRIVVDITSETLYAYDGDTLFMQEPISTGLELTPTSLGNFWVYRKIPDAYMQGPVPGLSDQYYDLPGVPWDLYFTKDGAAIHGAYWHDHFGEPWSHGCVNLPPAAAEILYEWADLGTPVTVIN
ncbi:MAG: L,D-transpeptidase family protein [Candidatus Pacebacteria bacterium]|nr:L,D-transpeptidase family protein [Candidatus Paceibacterota bacterium]